MSTKEKVIRAFLSDPRGENKDIYIMSCDYRKSSYKEYKPIFEELKKDGLVKIVEKTSKKIIYQYIPQK